MEATHNGSGWKPLTVAAVVWCIVDLPDKELNWKILVYPITLWACDHFYNGDCYCSAMIRQMHIDQMTLSRPFKKSLGCPD